MSENYSRPKQEILSLKSGVRGVSGVNTPAQFTFPREVRLALTVIDPDSEPTYPEPDDKPNKYGIAFCDGEFEPSQGAELPTLVNNATDNKPEVFALHVGNRYIPVGSLVIVKLVPGLGETDSGEWWIDTVATTIFLGKADALIATDNAGLVSWWKGEQGDEEDTEINFTCWNKFSPVPMGAWVAFFQNDDGYYLLPRGGGNVTVSGTNLIRFRLSQDLSLGSNAMAVILTPDGAGGYTTGETIYVYDWFSGGEPGMFSSKTGYEGFAVLRSEGAYDIVWMETPARWIYFTLDEDMHDVEGETYYIAGATVTEYHLQGRLIEEFIEVYDINGHFKLGLTGAKGTAEYNDQYDRYEVVTCEQMVVRARATLDGAMCQESGSFAIDNFVGIPFGEHVQAPDPLPANVLNTYNHRGRNAAKVILEYGQSGTSWTVVGVELVEVSAVIDVIVDECVLEKQTHLIVVETCQNPDTPVAVGNVGGNPYSFTQYKTECVAGVLILKSRTVDVDPCLAEGAVTYGEWSSGTPSGCCECSGGPCLEFDSGSTATATMFSDCPDLDGVVVNLTFIDSNHLRGTFTGGCGGQLDLTCNEGVWTSAISSVIESSVLFPITGGEGTANHNGAAAGSFEECCEGASSIANLSIEYVVTV